MNRMGFIKLMAATGLVVLACLLLCLLCGCRALGFDHGLCILCKEVPQVPPQELPYLQGYMYPPVP